MINNEKNSILIVDDEISNLDILSIILGSEYTIYKAENGFAAIEMADNLLPDVILLDILMPGISGYEVLENLKNNTKTRNIPVIILTGLEGEEEKALSLDAADFIQKPFNKKIIRLRVQNQMQIVNQIRAIREYAQTVELTLTKMKTIVNNYSGIIWSVDASGKVTSFDGQYLKVLDIDPELMIGKNADTALEKITRADAIDYIQKTFEEGPQEWTNEMGDKIFQSHTMPMFNSEGSLIGIVGSSDDVTELIRLHKVIAATEEKDKFFAKMSHEMRTPLNAVIGLSDMILVEGGLSEDTEENVEKISNAGASLLCMVNDILDISKIDSGNFKISPVDYDTAEMIGDTITQSIVHRGDKPVEFILNIDENIPLRLFGDDIRIKQVLNNILSNAFKYTREGMVELNIKCEPENDIIWLSAFVKDTGIGISKENLDSILFSDYSQLDLLSNRKIEGTGLGMSITKTLMDIMDGSISVESEYGKGSTFTVKIPQKYVTNEIIGAEIVSGLKNFHYLSKKHSSKSKQKRITLPYASVLVVDDIPLNLDVARGMMKPYRIKVDCVLSGHEAIDAIRNEKIKYTAVFMDQMMPIMDGIEAVRIIREEIGTEYAKTIPIIAFTANALSSNEEMFLNNGFQAFLTKPIEPARLDAVLMQWVRDEKQEKIYKEQNPAVDIEASFYGNEQNNQKDNTHSLFEEKIEGMDIRKGLERFNGDKNTFLQILKSFTTNTRNLLENIKKVNEESLKDYAIHVHGVKSSCRGICAEAAGNQAETLEKAAKAGDLAYVAANNAPFIEDVLKLISNVEEALNKGAEKQDKPEKPKKEKPYKEALNDLLIACENFKIEDIEAAINEIEIFEYTADDGLAKWLRENVDLMNYMEIADKLNAL